MSTLRIDDGDVITHLDRDADYRVRVFLNRHNGQLILVFADDESVEAGDPLCNEEARRTVESHPDDFVEIPVPDHSQMHAWFREFLSSVGCLNEYPGSIGEWLKQQDDHARKSMARVSGRSGL